MDREGFKTEAEARLYILANSRSYLKRKERSDAFKETMNYLKTDWFGASQSTPSWHEADTDPLFLTRDCCTEAPQHERSLGSTRRDLRNDYYPVHEQKAPLQLGHQSTVCSSPPLCKRKQPCSATPVSSILLRGNTA